MKKLFSKNISWLSAVWTSSGCHLSDVAEHRAHPLMKLQPLDFREAVARLRSVKATRVCSKCRNAQSWCSNDLWAAWALWFTVRKPGTIPPGWKCSVIFSRKEKGIDTTVRAAAVLHYLFTIIGKVMAPSSFVDFLPTAEAADKQWEFMPNNDDSWLCPSASATGDMLTPKKTFDIVHCKTSWHLVLCGRASRICHLLIDLNSSTDSAPPKKWDGYPALPVSAGVKQGWILAPSQMKTLLTQLLSFVYTSIAFTLHTTISLVLL